MTDIIKEICSSDEIVGEAAYFLYNEISCRASSYKSSYNNMFLSYPDLIAIYHKASGSSCSLNEHMNNEKIYTAIQVLCNPRIDLLKLIYIFIDEDDNFHKLSIKEIIEAKNTHLMEHPVTGDLIADYENYVFPFFSVKPCDAEINK
ncbi:hypothetical protein EH227_04735 [Rouxiella chamberiensis]|nr:hypothetical protein EH227_04735 [Rouxiella chamberiensis]